MKLFGIAVAVVGALVLLAAFIVSAPQWLEQLKAFFGWIIKLQEKFNVWAAHRHKRHRDRYARELEKSQTYIKYFWMEYRLASFRIMGRHANNIVQKNRSKLNLPYFRIIDVDGYLVPDLVSENRRQLQNWANKIAYNSKNNTVPSLAYKLAFTGTSLSILGTILLSAYS